MHVGKCSPTSLSSYSVTFCCSVLRCVSKTTRCSRFHFDFVPLCSSTFCSMSFVLYNTTSSTSSTNHDTETAASPFASCRSSADDANMFFVCQDRSHTTLWQKLPNVVRQHNELIWWTLNDRKSRCSPTCLFLSYGPCMVRAISTSKK